MTWTSQQQRFPYLISCDDKKLKLPNLSRCATVPTSIAVVCTGRLFA